MVQDLAERKVRELRIRKQVNDLEKDPVGRRKYLLLETDQMMRMEVDKEKGVANEINEQEQSTAQYWNSSIVNCNQSGNKVMGDAIKATLNMGMGHKQTDKEKNMLLLQLLNPQAGDRGHGKGGLERSEDQVDQDQR
ncbi:unnamed protein product [Arabis nemorensis]|uniref:Uncharacterized protein n=1 Tax=Arabis nemorensis TaxID=586526 RepID=A0A565CNP5_9BRAS|nr:unnamed protein product [Arabis nemorensis]